jgi:NAD(P)-dependent dehydrogenase (short-subunit alcohol dehydrogenase family)
MKHFENRVAVVTGAGSGIGQALSVLLAKEGCRLALADVNQPGLDQTQQQISALGFEAKTYCVDVADRARMQHFADQIVSDFGGVQLVVNNAGVTVVGDFADQSLDDFEWLMGVNFWGVVHGCKLFLPHLMAADEAHIVNISSVFGLVGVQQQSSYCASKFAVRGFSEALRAELSATRVGVTVVHPGGIATNIAATGLIRGDDELRAKHGRTVQRFKSMMPPERAARAILEGIKRKRARVLITRESYFLDLLRRCAPSASNGLLDLLWKHLQA